MATSEEVTRASVIDGKLAARSGAHPHQIMWFVSLLLSGLAVAAGGRPASLEKVGLPDWLFIVFAGFLTIGSALVLGGLVVRRHSGALNGLLAELAGLIFVAAAETTYAFALAYTSPRTSFLAYDAIFALAFASLWRANQIRVDLDAGAAHV